MYLDSVTDGMLRGLGQQMYCMAYNILDSAVSVALVYLLLPRFALMGYVFMIAFTEIFNFALSVNRLRRVTTIRFSVTHTLKAFLSAFGAVNFTRLLTSLAGLPASPDVLPLTLSIMLCLLIYALLLALLGCFDAREAELIKNFFRGLATRTFVWYNGVVNQPFCRRRTNLPRKAYIELPRQRIKAKERTVTK
jgi:stage V sporulation protein B